MLNKSQWYYFHLYCASRLLLLLQMLLCCFTLYVTFGVMLFRHSQSLHKELTVWFVSGQAAVHGPKCPLVHSPIQKSTTETTSMKSPSMLEIVGVWQIYDVSSGVSSHCTLPKSIVRPTVRCRQVWRPSYILKALGRGYFHCSVKFQYLHGSLFLIVHALCLSGAGWSWSAWVHHSPCLRWLTWSALGQPVHADLVVS